LAQAHVGSSQSQKQPTLRSVTFPLVGFHQWVHHLTRVR